MFDSFFNQCLVHMLCITKILYLINKRQKCHVNVFSVTALRSESNESTLTACTLIQGSKESNRFKSLNQGSLE